MNAATARLVSTISSLSEADREVSNLRIPPHSVEAEQAVLGGLLLDNAAFDRVSDLLAPEDFYRYDHRLIFEEIRKLIDLGKPADVITVFEGFERRSQADEVGGISYLNALAQNTPSAANIRRYAELVRERSLLRRMVTVADEIASSAFDNPDGKDARVLLDDAEAKVFKLGEEGDRARQGFVQLPQALQKVVERVDELFHSPNSSDITGMSTGFSDLDRMTAGFQPGDLIIIAGRPSMGKTTISLNVCENIAIESGAPVAVFSLEMGANQLAMRVLSSIGRIDAQRLRTGRLLDDDWPRLTYAIQKMQDTPLFINETPGITVFELRSQARRLARQCGKLGAVMVDYIQLMSSGSKGGREENRATEIGEISRSLKALAKELDCPVIALSQLNRSVDARQDKRPVMSDLRESGAIEQDADVILFIYRDHVYNKDSDKGLAELIIGKQRNGPTGKIPLTFLGEFTRFENHAGGLGPEPF